MNIQTGLEIYDPNAAECLPILSYDVTTAIAIVASVLGILWMGYNILMIRRIDLSEVNEMEGEEGLIQDMPQEQKKLLLEFGYKTYDAALSFLKLEYLFCFVLVVIAFLLLFFLTELGSSAAITFAVGSLVSMISSLAALILITRTSPRVAYCSKYGLGPTFRTAYQCCTAIGFGVASFNLLGISISIWIFKEEMGISNTSMTPDYFYGLFQAVAGYGLGISLVALITRVGGAMFEASTEAGSELVGKVQGSLPFAHSRNAATVGLHAGHHVEGIVGAGCDLLGSYSELTCVALLLGSNTLVGWQGEHEPCAASLATIVFPLTVLSLGLIISLIVSVVGVLVTWAESRHELITAIRFQRFLSGLLMASALYLACFLSIPSQFRLMGIFDTLNNVHAPWQVYLCALVGNIAYIVLALFGQFVTAPNYPFVESLAGKCRKGPAAAVTLGLAFGYLGSFAPTTVVILTAFYGFEFMGFYGIAVTILGIIATFPIQMALQSLSPLAISASTSVKVANLGQEEKDAINLLEESGQTAARVSRAISMGCSALVGLTLFGGFLRNASLDGKSSEQLISLTNPIIFAGLLVGAIFPFIIAGLTIRGSRKATTLLALQVQNQLRQDQSIAREESEVDYGAAVHPAAVRVIIHLILPVFLVVVLPFLLGLVISAQIVAGMLLAVTVSGTLFSSSATISGQAMQSTKKLIQSGTLTDQQGSVQGIGTVAHKAALISNSVGYVLKKNAGSSINASIKLMGMLAVLFGGQFSQLHKLI